METMISKLRITVLGCGTSTGVPLIQCQCAVCQSPDPKNKRLRASIWIQVNDKSILVDVSPDFREQALRTKIPRLDAVILTHPHYDHIGGMEELRSYNFIQKETIPVYGHHWSVTELHKRLPYLFSGGKVEGGGIARIDLIEFDINTPVLDIVGIPIIPIALDHGSDQVAAYRIGNFAYLTDCHHIPDAAFSKLENLDVLILDCLRLSKHDTHLNFDRAMEYALKIGAKSTIFTHMSHDFDFESFSKTLPKSFSLAYDGLVIDIKEVKRT
jgi:phosphoribosyl 1,2-cyclic phosphate phosphodiesterase